MDIEYHTPIKGQINQEQIFDHFISSSELQNPKLSSSSSISSKSSSFKKKRNAAHFYDRMIPKINTNCFDSPQPRNKLLTYKNMQEDDNLQGQSFFSKLQKNIDGQMSKFKFQPKQKAIPSMTLQTQALKDDFYLNLIGINNDNVLSIAVGPTVYLYNIDTKEFDKLNICDDTKPNQYVSCLKFCDEADNIVAISDSFGNVSSWDSHTNKEISYLQKQSKRVTSLSWSSPHLLTAAGREGIVYNLDTRVRDHQIQKLQSGHTGEVCVLNWNSSRSMLLSGGNDNNICVWSPYNEKNPVRIVRAHSAGVKALSWSGLRRNTFISGGGKGDGTIRLWDSVSGCNLSKVDTDQQVANILCSQKNFPGYFMVTFGYPNNGIEVWQEHTNDSIRKKFILEQHFNRPLYASISSTKEKIATTSCDGFIKIWDTFYKQPCKKNLQSDYLEFQNNQLSTDFYHLR